MYIYIYIYIYTGWLRRGLLYLASKALPEGSLSLLEIKKKKKSEQKRGLFLCYKRPTQKPKLAHRTLVRFEGSFFASLRACPHVPSISTIVSGSTF